MQGQPPTETAGGQVSIPLKDSERHSGFAEILRKEETADSGTYNEDGFLGNAHVFFFVFFRRIGPDVLNTGSKHGSP